MDQGAAALRQFASSYGDDAEKRFIMFDHSGDKGRIMLEPNRFFEFDPRSPPAGDEGEFHRVYREAMASFAAFQRSREANHNASVTLCHLGGAKDSDSSVSKLSYDQQPGDEQQISSVVREEDSEDIDALLYSDDDDDDGDMADEEEEEECSTGHTPLSDLTREDSDEITSSFHGGDANAGAGLADNDDEQQQQHEYVHEDGDEYDEGYGTKAGTAAAAVAVRPDEASDDKSSCKWSGYGGGGGGGGRKRQPRLAARRRSVMKKQRKERIRRTVRTLQSIVPGGDSMDPAVVLDEAILYMKVLQTRVRQLEASRQEDLSSIAIAHA